MKISIASGYTSPIRNEERRFSPDYAQRQFADPGLRRMRSGMTSGLGSLRHTMPHLKPSVSMIHMQTGGTLSNPIGQAYAASRPNLYNPDALHRRILALEQAMGKQTSNPAFSAFPMSSASLPYAEGGEAPDPGDPRELMESDDQESGEEEDMKQVVAEAMLALEGKNPDPDEAIQAFLDLFGKNALRDLKEMVAEDRGGQGERDEENEGESEEPDETEDLAAAGGGPFRPRFGAVR
jgi:hypothetical protein